MLNYRVNLSKAFEHHSCSSTPNSRILWSGVHPRGPSDPSGRTGHKQVVFRWPQETYGQTGEAQQGSDSFMASMDWFKGNIFSGKLWFVPHRVQNAPFQIIQLGKHVISWLMVSIICRQFKSFLRSLKILSWCVHASFNSGCWNLPPGMSFKKIENMFFPGSVGKVKKKT